MTPFVVAIHIVPRRGILDPQGQAVAGALRALGFTGVHDVHVGRHIVLELEADDEAGARRTAAEMCARLLANPVTEDFEVASIATDTRRAGQDARAKKGAATAGAR